MFDALMLLVGREEQHLACKNLLQLFKLSCGGLGTWTSVEQL